MEKRLINKVLENVLKIREFAKGLRKISKINPIIIMPILINND
tara:strand:- start:585 stop:713 length:129 start_codon:yes stop_codon:yes gene_type:complete